MAKTIILVIVALILGALVIMLLMAAAKYFLQLKDEYLLDLKNAERDAREAVDDLDYEIDRVNNSARRRRARRASSKEKGNENA